MSKRCAVYTRKSTEEGLDQAFNSLDAQYDACAAFIMSQKHEGWKLAKARYDDGGYSGGSMDRPGLQQLLDDVRAQKIDVVVVYKIDRLTRSLTDFARMVEVFDTNQVSFVSVTQQFNTTTSMGRLTLNVLLSFAQFEREVTAERIRDKIAASKKKGMWMGGVVPLGYDARDKKLVVNEAEAETVRTLFSLYLQLGSVRALKEEADRRGIVTKRHVQANGDVRGGRPFSRGVLYRLLTNPLYLGKIRHRGVLYEGQHDAIVDAATWDAVHNGLNSNAPNPTSPAARHCSLLTGLLFDADGNRLSPSHATKLGKRYRYYVSRGFVGEPRNGRDGWRLPAGGLEQLVIGTLADCLRDTSRTVSTFGLEGLSPHEIEHLQARSASLANDLETGEPTRKRSLLNSLLQRITLGADQMKIVFERDTATKHLGQNASRNAHETDATISVPLHLKRRGFEGKLVLGNGTQRDPDRYLVRTLAGAHRVLDQLVQGEAQSIKALGRQTDVHFADLARLLPLAFLAPDIVEAILSGRQPVELTAKRLKRLGDLPLNWEEQRQMLGFAAR